MNYRKVDSLPIFWRICLSGLVLFSILSFTRAIIYALMQSWDFLVIYLSSKAWLMGYDPYNNKILSHLWFQSGGTGFPNFNIIPPIYPVSTLAIVSPITLLSWQVAKIAWLVMNCIAFFAQSVGLIMLIKLRLNDWRSIALIAVCLCLYPVCMTISMGQPTLLAVSFGIWSIVTAKLRRNILSGLLLALALGLKMQIGIPFFCYYIICRRWNTLGFCLIGIFIIFTIGFLRLGWNDYSWVSSWQAQIKEAFSAGGINSPSLRNPFRYHLINLQFPLSMMTKNVITIYTISYILIISEVIVSLAFSNTDNIINELLILSSISIISLLAIYHRFYDASLLVLPITVLLLIIDYIDQFWIKFMIYLYIPFLFPWQGMITGLIDHKYISHSVLNAWWWNVIVLPLQVYCLLTLSFLILYLIIIFKINSSLRQLD